MIGKDKRDLQAYCEVCDNTTKWKYLMSMYYSGRNHHIYRCKVCTSDRTKSELVRIVEKGK